MTASDEEISEDTSVAPVAELSTLSSDLSQQLDVTPDAEERMPTVTVAEVGKVARARL